MIKNKINNKVYIGLSRNIKRRFTMHKTNLNNNKHKNDYLQKAWNKYGKENFEFVILEIVDDDNIDLAKLEQHYIETYNSAERENGYNLTYGGESCRITEEMRSSMRGKGSKLTDVDVAKIKLLIVCLMDRKEIASIFNVSVEVIKQIANLKNFSYIHEDLNYLVKNIKKIMIEERNENILKTYKVCRSIRETSNMLGLTESIVEKCVYKYTNTVEENLSNRKKIYDKVMSLYNKGVCPYKISKMLNIDNSTVVGYTSGKSNPYRELPYKKIKKNEREEIIYLYFEEGLTVYNIAEKYNVSRNTIETIISNHKYANSEVN